MITLNSNGQTKDDGKVNLIDAISSATNLQTAVITADRYSNEPQNIHLQKVIFDRYGLMFERKRGEFEDGVRNGYIAPSQIIERNRFLRILFAANGDLNRALQKRLFAKLSKSGWAEPTPEQLDRFYFAYTCARLFDPRETQVDRRGKEIYVKLYVMTVWYMPENIAEFGEVAKKYLPVFNYEWEKFTKLHETNNAQFRAVRVNRKTQQSFAYFNRAKWIMSRSFANDVRDYFKTILGQPKS